jgi:thioesterase domain-containing protein
MSGLSDDVRALMDRQFVALARYEPRPLAGRLVVFRARRQPLFHSFDESMGWQPLAVSGVDVRVVAGNHNRALFEPHVRQVAELLRPLLEAD